MLSLDLDERKETANTLATKKITKKLICNVVFLWIEPKRIIKRGFCWSIEEKMSLFHKKILTHLPMIDGGAISPNPSIS